MTNAKLAALSKRAAQGGWEAALYEYSRQCILDNEAIPEDQRAADWIYLLPELPNGRALILGGGWGTSAVALAQSGAQVTLFEEEAHRAGFLDLRVRQQGLDTIRVLDSKSSWTGVMESGDWGLIALQDGFSQNQQPGSFADMARRCLQALSPGGAAYFNVGNKWSLQAWLRRGRDKPSTDPLSLNSYLRALKRFGFTDIQAYAPLPRHDGIPLFYLPVGHSEAFDFFFRKIFPLFEMVSPESKKAYALEYAVAKLGVKAALGLRLTGLAKHFVSGYSLIARKPA